MADEFDQLPNPCLESPSLLDSFKINTSILSIGKLFANDSSLKNFIDKYDEVGDLERILFQPTSSNLSSGCFNENDYRPEKSAALTVYAYITPVLLCIGIVGNVLSLKVFLSRNMRNLSASAYLSALSISDLLALLCYVLVDWLRRASLHLGVNLSLVRMFDAHGLCQVQMYLSYVTRFVSAWIIVTFTMERYIGVCHPLKRRSLCVNRSAQRVLIAMIIFSMVILSYKPALTGRFEHRFGPLIIGRCSRNPNYLMFSFVLDSIFALSITLIPLLVISIFNCLIIRRLYIRHRRNFRLSVVTTESIVRMEFTIIFLVISFVFVALNIPYFCFWCGRFLTKFHNTKASNDEWDDESNVVLVARLSFYLNYSINFFLYSITGAYFRKELRMMFAYRKYKNPPSCSRYSNHSNHSTPQSWV